MVELLVMYGAGLLMGLAWGMAIEERWWQRKQQEQEFIDPAEDRAAARRAWRES